MCGNCCCKISENPQNNAKAMRNCAFDHKKKSTSCVISYKHVACVCMYVLVCIYVRKYEQPRNCNKMRARNFNTYIQYIYIQIRR